MADLLELGGLRGFHSEYESTSVLADAMSPVYEQGCYD